MDFFRKPKVTIGESGYEPYLLSLYNSLNRYGTNYGNDLDRWMRPEIEARARGTDAYSQELREGGVNDLSRFEPLIGDLVKSARNPIDDDLTKYFTDKFNTNIGNRIASRGAIGQGLGEGLESEANRDFYMGIRDKADARRAGLGAAASGLAGQQQGRALNRFNARGSAFSDAMNYGNAQLGYRGAGGGYLSQLLNTDSQRRLANEQLTQAGKSPFNQLQDAISQAAATFGALYGGSGTGGATPYQPPNINYNPGGVNMAGPGGGQFNLYGSGGGNQTPWGTPNPYSFGAGEGSGGIPSSGYNLGGASDPTGDYGGPMSRSGRQRYVFG